jgi:hypothetical protein
MSAQVDDAREDRGLGRVFALILFVEVVTVAALFVFSRHFAQP